MTENEANIIRVFEENRRYREIGTLEELQTMKEHGGFTGVELANIAAMQMKLKEYEAIGTPEECRAAVERNNEKTRIIDGVTECCGYDFGIDAFQMELSKFCPVCGRKIERNGEE